MTQLLVGPYFHLKLYPNSSRLSLGHKAEVPQSHSCFLCLPLPQLNADTLPSTQLFPWDSHLCHQNILTPLLFLSAGFLSVLELRSREKEKKNKKQKRLSVPALSPTPALPTTPLPGAQQVLR